MYVPLSSPENLARVFKIIKLSKIELPVVKLEVEADFDRLKVADVRFRIVTNGVIWQQAGRRWSDTVTDMELSGLLAAVFNSDEVLHGNIVIEIEQFLYQHGLTCDMKSSIWQVRGERMDILLNGRRVFEINIPTGSLSRLNENNEYNVIRGVDRQIVENRMGVIRGLLYHANLI